jgi:hypothetical protein
MYREDIILELKSLISDYEYEKRELSYMIGELSYMIGQWEEYDDPGSDPGLQYEQEIKLENEWKKLVKFCNENIK